MSATHKIGTLGLRQKSCWICGANADFTQEHFVKRSDIRTVLTSPSENKPLFVNSWRLQGIRSTARKVPMRDKPVKGIRNKSFCFDSPICKRCNNTLTQPYDNAWTALLTHVRKRPHKLAVNEKIKWSTIFPTNTSQQMRNLQLYFVKQVAGLIADSGIHTSLTDFQLAMQNATAFPYLRIQFFIERGIRMPIIVRTAPLGSHDPAGNLFRLEYEYILDDFGVRVTYAKQPDLLPRGKFAFDPAFGQRWLWCDPALCTSI